MKEILNAILNPYVSIGEKDILWEILRMEERDAELSKYARILAVSAACDAAAVPGQIGTVAEFIPEHYTGTVDELYASEYCTK